MCQYKMRGIHTMIDSLDFPQCLPHGARFTLAMVFQNQLDAAADNAAQILTEYEMRIYDAAMKEASGIFALLIVDMLSPLKKVPLNH